MRKSDDPSYRLDWEAWMAHQAGGIQAYRKLDEDDLRILAQGPLARSLGPVAEFGGLSPERAADADSDASAGTWRRNRSDAKG